MRKRYFAATIKKMSILRCLKPVTVIHVPSNSWWSRIADQHHQGGKLVGGESNRHTKGKNDRQICSWVRQRCSFIRFKASHAIGESTVQLFKKRYRLRIWIMRWVWSNVHVAGTNPGTQSFYYAFKTQPMVCLSSNIQCCMTLPHRCSSIFRQRKPFCQRSVRGISSVSLTHPVE